MKIIMDVPRGIANCDVMQEGRSESDFAHVSQSSPIALKRKELQDDPLYRTDLDAGINETRQKSTTRKRMNKEVKPI